MPDPQILINTYPPPVLKDIINQSRPTSINIYIDLKNVLTALFVKDIVDQIVLNSQTMNNIDSSIFQAIVNISAYWKNYARRLGLTAKIFICSDLGKSCYHRNIYKDYKCSRDIMNTSAVMGEQIKKIRDKNFILAEHICNKIPDVYFFCLKYLESDFLPYYLITRNFTDENIFHIVCSNDKDLYQSLVGENVIQIYKIKKVNNIVSRSSVLPTYLKVHKASDNKKAEKLEKLSGVNRGYLTIMMAINGDKGDDIPGIDRMGPAGIINLFSNNEVVDGLIGTPEELDNRISSGGKAFREDKIGLNRMPAPWQKVFLGNEVVTRAYKLISFESLSRWLERKDTIEKMKYIEYVDKLLRKEDIEIIPTAKSLLTSLQMIEDLYLTEGIINELF